MHISTKKNFYNFIFFFLHVLCIPVLVKTKEGVLKKIYAIAKLLYKIVKAIILLNGSFRQEDV